MIERHPDPSPEKPIGFTDTEIVIDFNEAQEIVEWLVVNGNEADEQTKTEKENKLRLIMARYNLNTYRGGDFKRLKAMHKRAEARLGLREGVSYEDQRLNHR